jgi:hypothetical protein
MTPSAAATDAARRLWARASGGTVGPEDVASAAERLCAQTREGLGRWIGAEGYRTLHDRALDMARLEHPALDGLSCLGGDQAAAAAVRANGAAQVAEGIVAWLAAMMDLLGRIIGQETAVRLVEQTAIPTPRGVVSTESEGGRDG